jgi:hypothetical protein
MAHNIMPTAAIIMQNSKSTFGILPGAGNISAGSLPETGQTSNGETNCAFQSSEL